MKNAIISGYPGVGKSTLADKDLRYIDLESSVMKDLSDDADGPWWYTYCNMAIHLAKQGHVVFVSSHAPVRQYLANRLKGDEDVVFGVCYPDASLEDEWIQKVEDCYFQHPTPNNAAELQYVFYNFTESIQEMDDTECDLRVKLTAVDYRLAERIESVLAEYLR